MYLMVLQFLILTLASNLQGQPQDLDPHVADLDSLKKWVGQNIQSINTTGDSKLAYEYAFIGLQRARAGKKYEMAGDIHQQLATWHYLQVASENSDSILYHDEMAFTQYKLAGQKQKMAKSAVYIAQSLMGHSKLDSVENYLFEALRLFEEVQDSTEMAFTLRNLSEYFGQTEDHQDAIDYAQRSAQLYEALGNVQGLGITLFGIVPEYIAIDDHETALRKANQSIDLIGSLGDDMDEAAYAYALNSRALVHQEIGEYELALDDHFAAWDVVKTLVNEEIEADGWKKGIAEVLYLKGEYSKSIPYFADYRQHILKRNKTGMATEMKLMMADAYEQTGQLGEAIELYKAGWIEKDSMAQSKLANVRSELQVKYETSRKDATITAQATELAQQRKIQRLYLGLGLALSLLTAGLFGPLEKTASKMLSYSNSTENWWLRILKMNCS